MKLGVSIKSSVIPGIHPADRAGHLVRLAQAAEGLGLDSIWVPDRTVFPTDIAARYPGRFGPGPDIPVSQQVMEPITTMSYLAGVTSSVKLGFGVVVLPFRHPVLNAKMVTTLDVLSGGRVLFGVGVGWMPEEFEGMRASYANRGAVTDEHIEMFKALCAGTDYSGKHFSISDKIFYPKPVQQPHPPVWVGGSSRAAIHRAARLGDGWLPNRLTPEEVGRGRQYLRAACEKMGRDPDEVVLGVCASLAGGRGIVRGKLHEYRDAGVEYLVASMSGLDTEAAIAAMSILAEELTAQGD